MPGRLCSLGMALALTSVSHAEIYTWTDAQGNKHFSDMPPDHPADSVELQPLSVIPMNENIQRGKRVSELRRDIQQTLAPEAEPRTPQERREAARRERQCQAYRNALERIQQQLRAGYSNEQGNRLRRKRREVSQRLARECLLG